jgi:hypothetical protein
VPPTDAAAGHDAVTPAPDATAGGTAGPTPQADPEPTLELAPELEAPMLPPFMPLPPHERPGNRAGASRVDDAAAQRNS